MLLGVLLNILQNVQQKPSEYLNSQDVKANRDYAQLSVVLDVENYSYESPT